MSLHITHFACQISLCSKQFSLQLSKLSIFLSDYCFQRLFLLATHDCSPSEGPQLHPYRLPTTLLASMLSAYNSFWRS